MAGQLQARGLLVALAVHTLAEQLAVPAHGFRALALAALGRLLEMAAEFHFTEDALALHFLFQGAEGLIDVVVADLYVHGRSLLLGRSSWH